MNSYVFGLVVLVLFAINSSVEASEKIKITDITPTCGSGYFKYEDKKCVATDKKPSIVPENDCNQIPGLQFSNGVCNRAKRPPEPTCGTVISDLVFDPESGECAIDRKVPRSASGDFVGDCFSIHAVPENTELIPGSGGGWLKVLSQNKIDDDTNLTVAEADKRVLVGCDEKRGAIAKSVRASDLARIGAHRHGWAYGVLVLPFKYYSHDKSFSSGVSFGPYFGWRYGRPGSTVTVAAGGTIGAVKGEVRDANGNITGTPDLQAFSTTVGVMWDINKSPNAKPFKIGIFYGVDYVSESDVVKYVHNRKPWLAFQIGFDFTDN